MILPRVLEKRSNSIGLTLLEIIISMLIFSLIMLGLINVFVAGKRIILSSRAQMTAAELARYALGNLSMQISQASWGNNCLSNFTKCSPYSQTIDNLVYAVSYVCPQNCTYNPYSAPMMFNMSNWSPNADNLYKVKVNVTWNETQP